jgi:hypothetical protein
MGIAWLFGRGGGGGWTGGRGSQWQQMKGHPGSAVVFPTWYIFQVTWSNQNAPIWDQLRSNQTRSRQTSSGFLACLLTTQDRIPGYNSSVTLSRRAARFWFQSWPLGGDSFCIGPKLTARYWQPLCSRFLWPHSNPCGEQPRGAVISAAGAAKMAVKTKLTPPSGQLLNRNAAKDKPEPT